MTKTDPIPQEFIQHLVETLLAMSEKLGPKSVMGQACLVRANYYLDLVEAWRADKVAQ